MVRVKSNRGSDALSLSPDVHRAIVRDVDSLLGPLAATEFRVKYFLDEWLTKINDPTATPASVRRERAIAKWLATEERNRRTNARLIFERTSFCGKSSDSILDTAARFVLRVIGERPPEDIWQLGRFSGGASTSKSRLMGGAAQKFRDIADVTNTALQYVPAITEGLPAELGFGETRVVVGNILFTVLKNAEIDRVACKEPDLNMWLQLAAGACIRRSLKRKAGIDLNDQSRNAELARQGSIHRHLATIDLSSASDSMTSALVHRLLPVDWFLLLDNLRSHVTVIDGEEHENAMFSSMGNGFTFELESLIFWALTCSTAYHFGVPGTISVYGDDIIAPVALVPMLRDVLGFCGFLLNKKKTHASGGFRESCGSHWLNGVDVKPFYVKEPIHHVSRLIHFLNRWRQWSVGSCGIGDERFYPLWKKWAKLVPPSLRGGRDCERIDALVTTCEPRSHLIRVARDKTVKDKGTYLHWHNLRALSPAGEAIEVEESIPLDRFVIRRRRKAPDGTFTSLGENVHEMLLFPQELDMV